MQPSIALVSLVLAAAASSVYAQGRGSARPDQTPIVEAVGCLSQSGADWILSNGSETAVATTTFTTPDAIKAAAEKPLGTQRYRLLGAIPFGPDSHKGHKMVVRGLLIKSGSEIRINVTSLQMLAEKCV